VLNPDELEEINLVAQTSGNDVILDALLLRLHRDRVPARWCPPVAADGSGR
jgi:hypothetical protein